jgi:hypothetical protein
MTKQIPLTKGRFALVDDADYEWLSQWKWYASEKPNGKCYARRDDKQLKRAVAMHRVITNAPDGMDVDHANTDGLDNRRCNLRVCNRSQNEANNEVRTNNTTGYKGVGRKINANYTATITINRKKIHLGSFITPEEAARAYDNKAIEIYGDFARLNFPKEG